ncbi:LexA family transcriptional regulator [Duganella aceris]|uniref:Helix-turn-helix domain-containing protein n=1 Tax=Duganella aceris TaxID=2703883 RepID=A0ABX0FPQ1_9BURK|nr:S24 family peptidase [Duganella aceris]NGZ86430.1 helix-turn-helix domain-containing protein [Duganella aceris]
MPALPLSQQQLTDAAKLKSLFLQWQQTRRDARLPPSQEAAAEYLGFGQSALAQYLNGKIPLNVDAALKLAHLLGVQVGDFSTTLAQQISQLSDAITNVDDSGGALAFPGARGITDDDDMAPETVGIKMVALHLQAGVTGFETQDAFEDGGKLHVPRQWVEENDLDPQSLLGIKVKGDSMVPLMYEGDIAVININDRARVNGGVFALNYNGQAVIKRLKYERREWWLASENPEFRPEPCKQGDCNVVGRVVRFEPRNFRDRL